MFVIFSACYTVEAVAVQYYSLRAGVAGSLIKIMRANPPVSIFSYSPTIPIVRQEIFFNASTTYDLDEDVVSYRCREISILPANDICFH